MSTRAVGYEEFLAINYNSRRKHFESLDEYKRGMINLYQRYLDGISYQLSNFSEIKPS